MSFGHYAFSVHFISFKKQLESIFLIVLFLRYGTAFSIMMKSTKKSIKNTPAVSGVSATTEYGAGHLTFLSENP